jgi:hypothetical protein
MENKMENKVKPGDYWTIANEVGARHPKKDFYGVSHISQTSDWSIYRQALHHGDRLDSTRNTSDGDMKIYANVNRYGKDMILDDDPVYSRLKNRLPPTITRACMYSSVDSEPDAFRGRAILQKQLTHRKMKEDVYIKLATLVQEGCVARNEEKFQELRAYVSSVGKKARLEEERRKNSRMAKRRSG